VLLVEDEPCGRDSLTRFLKHRGYPVDGAADLDAALTTLADLPLDAVVLDILFPDTSGPLRSGLDLLVWIRQRPTLARLPVVILTGQPLDDAMFALVVQHGAMLFYTPEEYAKVVRDLDQIVRRRRDSDD
jgi:DNA-binding response OmpR family regulator